MTTIPPPHPIRPSLREQWMLDSKITFLNHGSFGAVPRIVFEEQDRWRRRIEAEPVEMLGRRAQDLVAEAKRPVAAWLGMREADFGFVTNATEGVNAVLRSLRFKAGDELLTTSHVYGAVRLSMKEVARQCGGIYREIDLPIPFDAADDLVNKVIKGISDKTRLLVIDHITSPTALIFPVEKISAACAARGVPVLIDAAHAPGMIAHLNVPASGATFYAANLHKWACCAKGSAFLWVHPDHQSQIHPMAISHHYGEGLAREFAWQGSRDMSAWLTVPKALEFMSNLGWDQVISHNHQMTIHVQQMLCERWNVKPISPLDGRMIGSMVTVPLPAPLSNLTENQLALLQKKMYEVHHIEVPLMRWNNQCFARPCCQVYNTVDEYQRLADVISRLAI